MGIVFFCQSCGARFEVPQSQAGKRGHCKKCGQIMMIPRAEQLASMTAMPALAMAAAGNVNSDGGASIGAMLRAGISQVGLAEITADRMPAGYRRPSKPSPLDDAADSRPYVLASPLPKTRGGTNSGANAALALWRRQLGGIQKRIRWIGQTAYLISVPFLIVLIFGAAIGNRQLALMGAAAVVLLNIGRLAAMGANLAVTPLREGVNVQKLKKPAMRLIEPAATIVLVVLAFTFVPSLSRGSRSHGSIVERINAEAGELRRDIKREVKNVADVDKLEAQAQEKLKALGDSARKIDVSKFAAQAQEKLGGPSAGAAGTAKPDGQRP